MKATCNGFLGALPVGEGFTFDTTTRTLLCTTAATLLCYCTFCALQAHNLLLTFRRRVFVLKPTICNSGFVQSRLEGSYRPQFQGDRLRGGASLEPLLRLFPMTVEYRFSKVQLILRCFAGDACVVQESGSKSSLTPPILPRWLQ